MPRLRTVPKPAINAVTTSEMAELLGCSRATLYRNLNRGLYKQGLHFGAVNPTATRLRIRWNVEAVLKLHGLAS